MIPSIFAVGQLVKLKSGGPTMTIEGINEYPNSKLGIACIYFHEGRLHNNVFVQETLKLQQPKN